MKLCNRLLLHSWTTHCNGSNNDDKERGQRPPNPSSKRKKKKKKKRNEEQTELQNTFCTDTCNEHPVFRCIYPAGTCRFPFQRWRTGHVSREEGEGDVLKRNGQRYFADVRLKGWRYRCVACWKRVIKSDNALYRNATLFFPFFFNYGGINPPPGVKARREPWMKAERLNFTSLKRVGGRGGGRGGWGEKSGVVWNLVN